MQDGDQNVPRLWQGWTPAGRLQGWEARGGVEIERVEPVGFYNDLSENKKE